MGTESHTEDNWIKRVKSIADENVYARLRTKTETNTSSLNEQVSRDVPRSFGGKEASSLQQEALTEVLTAFSKYEGGEGYVR